MKKGEYEIKSSYITKLYDCDGVTSTTVMYLGLRYCGIDVIYRLPHRVKDGYGLKNKLVDYAKENNCTLIITVDNGIAAHEPVEYAKSLGIDVIVTDHHEPQEIIPDCLVIDAKVDKNYPFDDLCGCGVAFKVIKALVPEIKPTSIMENNNLYDQCLELVCIATVADAVNLVDENRTFIIEGLKKINDTKNVGLKKLLEITELIEKQIEVDNIGFTIGPCVNAAGRIDSPDVAIELFLSDDEVIAEKNAKNLIKLNEKRKDMQHEAMEKLEVNDDDKCIVAITENINAGINGIIASKIVDKYLRPCFVLSDNEKTNVLHGSGRTFGQFHIIDCILNHKDVVESGGGHKGACGVAIKKDNIDLFRKCCSEEYKVWLKENPDKINPIIDVTCSLDFNLVNTRLYNNINKLKPFGNGNKEPMFMSENIKISKHKVVGKKKNVVQFEFNQDYITIKGVGFESIKNKYEEIGCPENVNILYTIGLNEWPAGKFNIQLSIVDIERV